MSKPVTYCALAAALVFVAAAYNFEDPDYNQLLADDLDDVYTSSYSSPRHRRDEKAVEDEKCPPPRRGKPSLCCADEAINSIHEEKKDIKRACYKEITGKEKPQRQEKHHGPPGNQFDPFNCEKVEQHRKDMICIQQCVGQKLDFIDSDGNVKPDDFGKYVKKALEKEDYLSPSLDKIVSTCLEELKNSTQKASPEDSCKVTAIKLDHCIFKNVQLNCPEDKIKDAKQCARLQERLKSGHFTKGAPPPPPSDAEDE